jgi:nucleoid DNA-binding protein
MKKEQLARELARESRITEAAAADQVDRIVSEILKKVRSGRSAAIPGLGTFHPTPEHEITFEGEAEPRGRTGRQK